MASLVLKMSMSLDGYIAPAAGGDPNWIAAGRSQDSGRWLLDTVSGTRAHLLGAGAYRELAGYWPTAPGPVAAAMNELPKIVFSASLATADWGPATIERGDLAAAIARLKAEHGEGYLLAQAGVRFARSLVQTGLIDEYRLAVHPVFLGDGEPLFTTPTAIEPVSTTAFSGGVVVHAFRARG